MSEERKAVLKIGFVQFITDVSTAIVLEDKLSDLTQVVSRWVDEDEKLDIEPKGLVLCATPDPTHLDVEIISRSTSIVYDTEWQGKLEAARKAFIEESEE